MERNGEVDMMYVPGLVLALAALWFSLSGEAAPLFLGLGALSMILTLWLVARLRILDRDASPYHRFPQLLIYLVWLIFQIIKANLSVIARVLSPGRAIDPAIVRIRTNARTDLGKTLFANAITLTPGTVTVDVVGDRVVVHALVAKAASTEAFDSIDRIASGAADGRS
jgi:multicomponent Na+:H+ antiporter subunit E